MFHNSFEKLNFIAMKMCLLHRLRFEDIFDMRWLFLVLLPLLLFSVIFFWIQFLFGTRNRYHKLCYCCLIVDSGAEWYPLFIICGVLYIVCMQLPLWIVNIFDTNEIVGVCEYQIACTIKWWIDEQRTTSKRHNIVCPISIPISKSIKQPMCMSNC